MCNTEYRPNDVGGSVATYHVPVYTNVWTVVEVEASSLQDAYQKGLEKCPPSVEPDVLEDQDSWEVDCEGILEVIE